MALVKVTQGAVGLCCSTHHAIAHKSDAADYGVLVSLVWGMPPQQKAASERTSRFCCSSTEARQQLLSWYSIYKVKRAPACQCQADKHLGSEAGRHMQ